MVCHGEVCRIKPTSFGITYFYVALAFGGAVGGVFVALCAPRIFDSYVELRLGLILCALLIAAIEARERRTVEIGKYAVPAWSLCVIGATILSLTFWAQSRVNDKGLVASRRNFYGVCQLVSINADSDGSRIKLLRVGEIIHGAQFIEPQKSKWAIGYHGENSGVGIAMRELARRGSLRIGIVGLGVGTLAAYGRKGDYMRFYEINPIVKEFAERDFTYLRDSAAKTDVVMGDARLTLEAEADQHLDLLVLDAFSSDAVPVHLLTREAFNVYLRHLRDTNGVIAVNVSNKHLDLVPVVRRIAEELNLTCVSIPNRPVIPGLWLYASHWVLLSSSKELEASPSVRSVATDVNRSGRRIPLWTDEHTSLWRILK
jgi:hypothetical protein